MKRKLHSAAFFVPITRTEEHDDYTLVEGYAYVNGRVPSDRYNLTRAAMEAASEGYMQFPAVREMHGSNAAGTGLGLAWDDRGVQLSAKIVDPVARAKVKEGVYRGFSVGVQPTIVRGSDVTACRWNETSLVDRPADSDAVFTMVRVEAAEAETEVEVVARASFSEYLAGWAPATLRDMALDYLWNSLWDIQYWETNADGSEMTAADKEAAVRETCAEFAEFMVGVLATGEIPNISEEAERVQRLETAAAPEITRVMIEETLEASEEIIVTRAAWTQAEAAQAELPTVIERLTTAETTISTLETEREEAQTTIARVQGEHATAIERIRALEAMPARNPPVRRSTEAVERSFISEHVNPDATRIQELKGQLAEINRMTPTSEERESSRRIGLITQIKQQLRELGEPA